MIREIFLNVPVADLRKARAFYKALGFAENPDITGDSAAMFRISESIALMLATHEKFKEFTPKGVCDTATAVEILLNLRCDSREEVDGLIARALEAGGSTYDKPEDLGFMYSHSFVDLDGHGWGLFHMSTPPSGD